jgi:hypothetical protein
VLGKVQQWRDGLWWSSQRRKGRKWWESNEGEKKGRDHVDRGRKTIAFTQNPRVNLGRAAAVHCFPSFLNRELGVEPKCPSLVSAPYVRMKV